MGPFTIRRLMFRAGVFSGDGYSAEDVRLMLPSLVTELRETPPPAEFAAARHDLEALLGGVGTASS